MFRCCVLVVAVAASAAHAETALERAKRQVNALDFPAASKSLQEARKAGGLSREEVLLLYELSGIVAATLGDAAGAKDAFVTLAMLDPDAKLRGRMAPKVQTPFLEAKALARDSGALELTLEGFESADGRLSAVRLACPRDVKLAKALIISIEEDGVPRTARVPWQPVVTVPVSARAVTVSARVIGLNEWELGRFGPFSARAPEPVVEPPPPPVTPPLVGVTPPSPSALRPLGWTAASLGAAALIVGAVFGARSADLRRQLETAPVVDGVVQLTRVSALQLSEGSVMSAIVANACFIGGGVLLATGVVLWLLDLPPAPVSLAPVPGGLVGAFSTTW